MVGHRVEIVDKFLVWRALGQICGIKLGQGIRRRLSGCVFFMIPLLSLSLFLTCQGLTLHLDSFYIQSRIFLPGFLGGRLILQTGLGAVSQEVRLLVNFFYVSSVVGIRGVGGCHIVC